MKKMFLSMVILTSMLLNIQSVYAQEEEKDIEKVLVKSYVDGVFRKFNEKDIRKGFHEDFQFHFPMRTPSGDMMRKVVLNDWIKMLSGMQFGEIDYKIVAIHQSGAAATSVSEIYQDGQKLYTDYLVWRKVDEDWKIMGKTYEMHQSMMR